MPLPLGLLACGHLYLQVVVVEKNQKYLNVSNNVSKVFNDAFRTFSDAAFKSIQSCVQNVQSCI